MKDGCCKTNEKCWIVATINPISCRCPVHHGTFFNVLIDKFRVCKHREIIIFAHNYFRNKHKQSNTLSCITIKYISLFIEIRYFVPITINTHIDCSNNSKCSVRCIFKATSRSLESVTLSIFCYDMFFIYMSTMLVSVGSQMHNNKFCFLQFTQETSLN